MPELPTLPKGALTRADVAKVMDAIVKHAENEGVAGKYENEAENPLVYGAYFLLDHLHRTHPDGITGTLRAIQHIERRLFRLDEKG